LPCRSLQKKSAFLLEGKEPRIQEPGKGGKKIPNGDDVWVIRAKPGVMGKGEVVVKTPIPRQRKQGKGNFRREQGAGSVECAKKKI